MDIKKIYIVKIRKNDLHDSQTNKTPSSFFGYTILILQ